MEVGLAEGGRWVEQGAAGKASRLQTRAHRHQLVASAQMRMDTHWVSETPLQNIHQAHMKEPDTITWPWLQDTVVHVHNTGFCAHTHTHTHTHLCVECVP